jgi:EmrB/QacA subfamily drug resistance transporter
VTGPTTDRRRVRLVFGGLVLTILLASLDQTIVSSALPTIVGELGGVELMSWVVTAYLLAATIVMPAYGRLGDLIGRKGLFLTAISTFLLGSVICGLAGSVEWLIVGRAVQGLGGGGLVISAQAIVADVIPARERGRYAGVLGGVFAVSSIAGPLLGGYFTDGPGWRWSFWINLPLGALALIVAAVVLHLPQGTAQGRPRIDVSGITWSATAVTCLVLLSSWGGHTYPWTSPTIVGLAAGAVAAALLFVRAERRAENPIIPLSLFRDRTFVLATAAGLVVGIGLFATSSYLPTFLQMVSGHSASTAGLLMVPMMAGVLGSSIISGLLISRTGRYKGYPVAGMITITGALLLMSTMTSGTSSLVSSAYLALFGIGVGLVLQILVLLVQNAADPGLVGTATAANNFFREIGASLGVAVVGSVFTARLTHQLGQALPPGTGVAAGTLTPDAVATLPSGLRTLINDAYAHALTPLLGWLAPLFLIGLLLVAALPNLPLRTTLDRVPPDRAAEPHLPTPARDTR